MEKRMMKGRTTATIGFEPMIPVRFRLLSASSRLRQGFKLTHKLRLLNDGLSPLPVYGLGADLIPLARLERDRTPSEGDVNESLNQ